jgi:hypothetical protein
MGHLWIKRPRSIEIILQRKLDGLRERQFKDTLGG